MIPLYSSAVSKRSHWKKNITLFISSSLIFLLGFFCPYQSFSQNGVTLNIDYSPWSAYVPNIKKCALGEYTLPDPVKITQLRLRLESVDTEGPTARAKIRNDIERALITYQIYGWQNNFCRVVIREAQNNPSAGQILGPTGFECDFTLDDLQRLGLTAERLANGQLLLTGQDPDADIKGRACRSMVQSLPPLPKPSNF